MTYKLIIDGTLPGLNQYQYACRSHFSKGNKMKKDAIAIVMAYIYQQLQNVQIEKQVRIDYVWCEPNRRRDQDNICAFGRKVIQDALVNSGVLKNDGWHYVSGHSDTFMVDKNNPHIEVVITEIEKEN